MFIVVFNEQDKMKLEENNYKLIYQDINNDCKKFIFEDKGKLNFANENIKVFRTNKMCF